MNGRSFPPRAEDVLDDVADDVGPGRLHVFVPAIMSVGIVFSIFTLLRDLFRWSGRAGSRRRVQSAAVDVARSTIDPVAPVEARSVGLLGRRAYLGWAVLLVGGALYVVIGSAANYLRPGGYVSDIAWLLAVSLVLAALLGFLGGLALAAAGGRPVAGPTARGLLRRTPLATVPITFDDDPPASGVLAAVAIVSTIVAVISTIWAAAGGRVTRAIDEPVADWLGRQEHLDVLRHLDPLGRTDVAVVLAALVGLGALRCRPLAFVYPVTVVLGGLLSTVLKAVIDRPRPAIGERGDLADAFPSGHVLQAVLIAVLVPLAIEIITGQRRWVVPLRIAMGLGAFGAAVHRIRIGDHWPVDALGGAAIGLALGAGALWTLDHRRLHRLCVSCPWNDEPSAAAAIDLSPRAARRIAHVGQGALAAIVVAMVVGMRFVGIPTNPEGASIDASIERWIQLGLLALLAVAVVLAFVSRIGAAVLTVVAGAGLGVFAAVQYRPAVALAIAVTATIPGVLLWLSWQHRRSWRAIATMALVTGALLFGSRVWAENVYDRYYGPTHPDSVVELERVDAVEWMWVGVPGSDDVVITAGLDDDVIDDLDLDLGRDETAAPEDDDADEDDEDDDEDVGRLELVVTAVDGEAEPVVATAEWTGGDVVRFEATGLEPDERYEAVVHVDGEPDQGRGTATFRTQAEGPFSFRLLVASCARAGSNGAVFDAMRDLDAFAYLLVGDAHYGNLASEDAGAHRAALERMLRRPGQQALYRSTPTAYVWDDHDYGPNDSGAANPGGDAVRTAYRQLVPWTGLVDAGATASIEQAFSIGRVRIVMTDNRSHRTADTMLGAEQEAWLIEELVTASQTHALVVWANGSPWVGPATPGADTWAGYPDERRRIADAIAAAGVADLVMVSGDAHMVALDDGTNTDYSTGGGAGFPLLHAAALDRPGSVKGGPYSDGTFPGGGQFGVIDVVDEGDEIVVTLSGHTWDDEVLVTHTFRFPADA